MFLDFFLSPLYTIVPYFDLTLQFYVPPLYVCLRLTALSFPSGAAHYWHRGAAAAGRGEGVGAGEGLGRVWGVKIGVRRGPSAPNLFMFFRCSCVLI